MKKLLFALLALFTNNSVFSGGFDGFAAFKEEDDLLCYESFSETSSDSKLTFQFADSQGTNEDILPQSAGKEPAAANIFSGAPASVMSPPKSKGKRPAQDSDNPTVQPAPMPKSPLKKQKSTISAPPSPASPGQTRLAQAFTTKMCFGESQPTSVKSQPTTLLNSLLTPRKIVKHHFLQTRDAQQWSEATISVITPETTEEASHLIYKGLQDAPKSYDDYHNTHNYTPPFKNVLAAVCRTNSQQKDLELLPIPLINLNHIYNPEDNGGFHHQGENDTQVKIIFTPAQSTGTYGGVWHGGYSSFFCRNLSKVGVTQTIKEAYFAQPIAQDGNKILAQTNDGTCVEIFSKCRAIEVQAHPVIAYVDTVTQKETATLINGITFDSTTLCTMAHAAAQDGRNIRYCLPDGSCIVDAGSQVAAYLQEHKAIPAESGALSDEEIKHAKGIYVRVAMLKYEQPTKPWSDISLLFPSCKNITY